MALAVGKIFAGELGTSSATLVAVTAAQQWRITEIIVNNNDSGGAARTFTLHFVTSGDTADDSNKMFFEVTVDPSFPHIIPMNTFLEASDFIRAHASGLDVAIRISGIKES